MSKKTFPFADFTLVLLFFLGLGAIGYLFPREAFYFNLLAFILCFGTYLLLYRKVKNNLFTFRNAIIMATIARLLLLFALPSLSDDFYRFLFDGHLLIKGINPYAQLPLAWVQAQGLDSSSYLYYLFEGMNSPGYFSVYPPLHQVFFGLAALSGESLLPNLLVLRSMLIAFDLLNIWLIVKLLQLWHQPKRRVLLYALNPLVILELTGNLHSEGMVLTGLLAVLYCFERGKTYQASAAWAWAVGIKLTPLMMGPILLRKAFKSGSSISFFAWSALFLFLALGLLFLGGVYLNFWQSLRLYSSSFEFNASIYYLIRWVSGFFMDYNPIVYVGPFLTVLAALLILALSFLFRLENAKDLAAGMVWIYLVYLLLQTVVHPWYLIPAFGMSVLTGNRVFLVWTGLVFLSYGAYQSSETMEQTYLLITQYGLLFFTIFLEMKSVLASKKKLI